MGLPEVVGFALGAGAMASAMAALEANLSGSERARRVVREGITAELHRVAADLVPRVLAMENPLDSARHHFRQPHVGGGSVASAAPVHAVSVHPRARLSSPLAHERGTSSVGYSRTYNRSVT